MILCETLFWKGLAIFRRGVYSHPILMLQNSTHKGKTKEIEVNPVLNTVPLLVLQVD
jgi:hypothetical protein